MKLRQEFLQVLFGAVILAVFIQLGVMTPARGFVSNLFTGVVVALVTRILARLFGG